MNVDKHSLGGKSCISKNYKACVIAAMSCVVAAGVLFGVVFGVVKPDMLFGSAQKNSVFISSVTLLCLTFVGIVSACVKLNNQSSKDNRVNTLCDETSIEIKSNNNENSIN